MAFACTCTIASYPSKVFGAKDRSFAGKKQARAAAAADAVRFLIAEGKLDAEGSTFARKKAKLSAGIMGHKFDPAEQSFKLGTESTYGQKVSDLAPLLGLSTPQYHLTPESLNAPNLLSGYATFTNSSHLPGQIGRVRNVFGKKGAKEAVAKEVWTVMLGLAKERGVTVEEA